MSDLVSERPIAKALRQRIREIAIESSQAGGFSTRDVRGALYQRFRSDVDAAVNELIAQELQVLCGGAA
jgi:hypothetical protein